MEKDSEYWPSQKLRGELKKRLVPSFYSNYKELERAIQDLPDREHNMAQLFYLLTRGKGAGKSRPYIDHSGTPLQDLDGNCR